MHIITQNCCNDAACVPVCPVNCIHPTPEEPEYLSTEMLYIDPATCIDCGACIDACPVSAIAPDYELEPEQEAFRAINAQWYEDEAHRGYPTSQPLEPARTTPAGVGPLRVAIVGAGPAGCYAAEQLTAQRGLDVEVNLFERLPAPGGLVRYGVAPDHQSTKEIADALTRVLSRRGVTMHLNVEVGTDLTHEQLLEHHHAVIYAVGAAGSRPLGIPGDQLPGSHSAAEFVAWYNGHPDTAERKFDLSGERAVVVGNGNVALDIARVLLTDVDRLRHTDIAEHALQRLAESRIREVVVLGRRGPAQASFTIAEFTGLRSTSGITVVARHDETALDPVTAQLLAGREQSIASYKAQLVQEVTDEPADGGRRVVLRFLVSPERILGTDRVAGVEVVRNELVAQDGRAVARATEETETIACGLVLRSVGYHGRAVHGVPFDSATGVIPNQAGRVVRHHEGRTEILPGLFATGWIKRGPSGVIGTNKKCATDTVAALLEDHLNGRLPAPARDQKSLERILAPSRELDLSGWKAIDDYERRQGKAVSRPRLKLVSVDAMLEVAGRL
jgi:ferredoxin/flavodoxin---NADP+ reductase